MILTILTEPTLFGQKVGERKQTRGKMQCLTIILIGIFLFRDVGPPLSMTSLTDWSVTLSDLHQSYVSGGPSSRKQNSHINIT